MTGISLKDYQDASLDASGKTAFTPLQKSPDPGHPVTRYFGVMAGLDRMGIPTGPVVAFLVVWAEEKHPDAYGHLADLRRPEDAMKTIGAMCRRMESEGHWLTRGRFRKAKEQDPEEWRHVRVWADRRQDEPSYRPPWAKELNAWQH